MGIFPHSKMLNDIRDIMTFDIRDPPRKKTKILGKTFVNRNGNVVTLHRESVKGQKTKGKRQMLAITKQIRCKAVVSPFPVSDI